MLEERMSSEQRYTPIVSFLDDAVRILNTKKSR